MALEPLDAAIESLRTVLEGLSGNLQADLAKVFPSVSGFSPEEMISEIKAIAPTMLEPYLAAASDYTVQWYNDLAPTEPFVAELPNTPKFIGGVIDPKRLAVSIEWAVHTAKDVSPLDKLNGSFDRMVHDASRHVVQHNAVKEGVKYLRHAAPGACPFCRLLAIRGPVYTTAANAIKGHDSCHCVAVPIRKGTVFNPPAHYDAWEQQYIATTKALKAAGETPNLNNILAAFEQQDQEAIIAAEKLAKKKISNAKSSKKFHEKKKAEKAKAITDWLAAEQQHKADVSQWLIAEAKFGEKQAKTIAKKTGKQQAQAKFAATKKAEKDITPASVTEQVPDQSKLASWAAAPDPAHMVMHDAAGGSHGAVFYLDGNGKKWIVKQQSEFHIQIEKAAARLQAMTGLPAPATYKLNIAGVDSLVQEVIDGKPNWVIKTLNSTDALQLQKNQVFDWLIGNHDASAEQWIKKTTGEYVGVDKGQAFKWYGKDKLNWNFKPNSESDTPIYNLFWQNYINGKQVAVKYDSGQLHEFIQHVQGLDDGTVKALIRPYAEAAAEKGKLINTANDAPGLLSSPGVPPNDVEALLNAVVARKNNLQNDFDAFYANATKAKTAAVQPASGGPIPSSGLADWEQELLAGAVPPTSVQTASLDAVKDAFVKKKAETLGQYKLTADKVPLSQNAWWNQYQEFTTMTPEQFGQSIFYHPMNVLDDAEAVLEAKKLELSEKALGQASMPVESNGFLTQLNYLHTISPAEFKKQFPATYNELLAKVQAKKVAVPKVESSGVITGKPATFDQAYSFAVDAQKAKFDEFHKADPFSVNPYANQLVDLQNMSPVSFAAKYNVVAADGTINDNWLKAIGKHEITPGVPVAKMAFDTLTAAEQKKIYNSLHSKMFAVKKKLGIDSPEYQHLKAMQPWEFDAEKNGLPTIVGKKFIPEPPKIVETMAAPTKEDFYAAWDDFGPDDLKKHYNSLHSKMFAVKKKFGIDSPEYHQISSMSPFDFWLTKQQESIKIPVSSLKVKVASPPKHPANDPVKIQKVAELHASHPTPGFNPVKALTPDLSLKDPVALTKFDTEIGVGYLTEDQLFQVLSKYTTTSLQKKWLKKYADAKGVDPANAVEAKLAPKMTASKPSSSGVAPTYHDPHSFDPSKVTIKNGTQHTLAREADTVAAQSLKSKFAVPDINAPLGSSSHPHVFSMGSVNSKFSNGVAYAQKDFKTFGSLLTDQNKANWKGHVTGINSISQLTGSWYTQILGEMRAGKFTNPKIKHMDQAFHAPQAKKTEEWMIISRGTGRREFNTNTAGPDGKAIKLESAGHATPEDFKHLVGKTYTNDGYMETSITKEPGYGKQVVRVLARIPPESRLIYADGTPDGFHAISQNSGEREIVFPRGCTWRVLEVKKSSLEPFQVDVIVELEKQGV